MPARAKDWLIRGIVWVQRRESGISSAWPDMTRPLPVTVLSPDPHGRRTRRATKDEDCFSLRQPPARFGIPTASDHLSQRGNHSGPGQIKYPYAGVSRHHTVVPAISFPDGKPQSFAIDSNRRFVKSKLQIDRAMLVRRIDALKATGGE